MQDLYILSTGNYTIITSAKSCCHTKAEIQPPNTLEQAQVTLLLQQTAHARQISVGGDSYAACTIFHLLQLSSCQLVRTNLHLVLPALPEAS